MKRFIPLGVLLFLFGCGSRAPRESRRIDLVTDRHQAGRLLASLSPETLTRDERIAEARNLAGFLQKHPGWLPLATVEKLMALHEAAPGIVEGAFVNYLKVWPVPGYYPLRDDPAAVRVIRLLAKWNQGPLLLQAATALNRRITVEDPRAKVRLTLADVSHLLPAGTERQELLKEFLLSKTARYTLFKATASAMGRIGTRDPSMVPIFIRGLYTVRQGISASLESAFALGTCYADAAALSRRLLVSVALHSRDIIDGVADCTKHFPTHGKYICPLYGEARRMGWLRQDPIYFENSALRVLAHRGDKEAVLKVVSATGFTSLIARWRAFMDRFNSPGTGTKVVTPPLATMFEAANLPFFGRDLSLRAEALHMAAVGGYLPAMTGAQAEAGSWTHFGLPTYGALALTKSDPALMPLFTDGIRGGACHITAARYYGIIRAQALNSALADEKDAMALSRAWNKEITTARQWEATRHWWQPRLLKEVGNFARCGAEVSRCLTPTELYRLEIAKNAWYFTPLASLSSLMAVTANDLMTPAAVPPELAKLEGFVTRPWADDWEAVRQKGARAVLAKELSSLRTMGELLKRCRSSRECYEKELKKQALAPFMKARAARMLLTLIPGPEISTVYHLLPRQEREMALERFRNLSPLSPHWSRVQKEVKTFETKGVDVSNNLKFQILYYQARRQK